MIQRHPAALYEGRPVLTLREAARLLLLAAVVLLAAEFCFSRLRLPALVQPVLQALVILGAFLLPTAFLVSARGIGWQTLWGRSPTAAMLGWTVPMALCAVPVVGSVQWLWCLLLQRSGFGLPEPWAEDGAALAGQILFVVLPAVIAEEVTLRGVLLPALERRIGRTGAIWAVTVGFALLQGDLMQLPGALVLGLLLALLTVRSGSLVPAVLFRFLHTAAALLVSWGVRDSIVPILQNAPVYAQPQQQLLLAAVLPFGLLSAVLSVVFYRSFRHRCPASPELFRENSPLGGMTGLCMLLSAAFIGLRMGMYGLGG